MERRPWIDLRPPTPLAPAGEVAPPEFGGALAREATPTDAPAMLRVLEASFPRWPPQDVDVAPIDHLRWKMETAEGEPISPHDVVVADGDVGAVMLAWVGRGKVGDELLVTDAAVDLAVHPDHRGKRFARLINEPSTVRNEHRDDYFNFDTRSNSAPVLHMYNDDHVIRGMRVWTRPFGFLRSAVGLRHRHGRRSLARRTVATATRHHAPMRRCADRIELRSIRRFDARADALWEAAASAFDIVRVRDACTLNWRYLDPRAGRITTLGAFERDELIGYAAARHPAEGVASLLDVFAMPGRVDAVVALVGEVARVMRSSGATRLDAWLPPGHPYQSAFSAAGLVDSGVVSNVQFSTNKIRESSSARQVLQDPDSAVHVSMGDFDWV